jgi:hypothetical protein
MLIRDFAKGGRYNSLYAVSDDEGTTWSRPKRLPASLTGDRHCPIYAPDGRLVVLMRDKLPGTQSPTSGHFIAWVGRYEDILAGKPGQYRVKLLHSHAGGDCAYPSIHLLPNGDFIATTYIKYDLGPRHQSTVSTRFNLPEIDRRIEAKVSAQDTAVDPATMQRIYHYYCAVCNRGRCIALATSKDLGKAK